MFDNVSWGELLVCSGLAVTFIGRKDLPGASRTLGNYVGRLVGMLQGGRQRIDKFASDNELKVLQNELRAGLREIDAVKSELAVASTSGLIGRGLGSTLGRQSRTPMPGAANNGAGAGNNVPLSGLSNGGGVNAGNFAAGEVSSHGNTAIVGESAPGALGTDQNKSPLLRMELAHRSHAVAAVAEDEWEKKGIGFKSRAEMGTFGGWAIDSGSSSGISGGAALMSDLIQESLIHDQHDRTVQEQDDMLRSRAKKVKSQRSAGNRPKEQGGDSE
mmetsp:Transcript_33330/g.49031  ORF Transcript_33330/g.49031 Transcript_33330/m.49031 type:complete len:273 (-) Transcript_33330:561-1379(-)|eukprot:CAMPEP_0195511406 /NCGR_PEP_ID=MMETSP0794_2-20130614/3732_1 /TAXON_ID=515487 /ORGANISM="Stephanopyxis turris, Strain CCMP 815" /LENGTH=272 /DNA_ID=CAMNT_0040638991 /DNA_START=40 /DNA_END=858 /DNA_ORIENTATION=+